MTQVGSGNAAGAGLLNRLFQRTDTNKNSAVSSAELSELLKTAGKDDTSASLMATYDADGDGALTSSEWPDKLVSDQNLGQLLSLQDLHALQAMNSEERNQQTQSLKQAYFSRVDADGNGVLSKDEVEAGRVLNMARTLDEGQPPNTVVMVRPGADQNALTMQDIMIGQRIDTSALKASPLSPAQKAELAAALAAMPTDGEPAKVAPEASADATQDTPQSMAEKVSTASFSQALITRLLAQFATLATMPAASATDISA